ncbi:sialate O-acetylesterase [Cytophagaceae bacterium YF14B1]|uniref:Sialate O-acetylesterase n=1 Tax=Xanthocytophaga flava TaxID=3048013 RepID=A0AAE3QNT6_9BACT|nr:sialate O-acetylesterase [Xanthocytophaga flavus]MDJ1482106.1 sialate O-acetylesterase [Xanthocytophaga flavus]
MKKLLLLFFISLFSSSLFATVKVASLFSDGMVLQRNTRNAVWGWATPGALVTITWQNKTYTVTTDNMGSWMLYLDATPAGGPYTLTITEKNQIQINDILVGEVWICSGQSNMEWRMNMLNHRYDADIASSSNSNIRHIKIKNTTSIVPLKEVTTNGWKSASPENTPEFSAVAYFFARELYSKLKVPIGLISSNWGGTVAQAWTSIEGLEGFANYQTEYTNWKTQISDNTMEMEKKYAAYQVELASKDKGSKKWMLPSLATMDWKTMSMPNNWEHTELDTIDGIVWLRKEIILSKADIDKGAILHLGAIDDEDITYVNGIQVGATEGYNNERSYTIKDKLLKPGKNVIAIRVLDTYGGGGLWGEAKKLVLETGGKQISLAGDWQYKISEEYKNLPHNPRVDMNSPNHPALLFNGMIAPLIPYGIKGVIWYQGESNADKAYEYRKLFPSMITDWRNRWKLGEFPFLFVQLANFMKVSSEPAESDWAELREAQVKTLSLPVTGMACIIDIGEAEDIHPKNKLDVGKRLAFNARKIAYGEDVVHSGPLYFSQNIEGDKVRITFTNIGTGLIAKGNELKGFAIAGDDRKFVWAQARIDGNQIVVWSDKVTKPVAVRYGWANNPEGCNLYNVEEFPASPFRTDEWKGITTDR